MTRFTPPDFDDLDRKAKDLMPMRDRDWLDQLDWKDAAFAYGLLAFVGALCFLAGRFSVAWF